MGIKRAQIGSGEPSERAVTRAVRQREAVKALKARLNIRIITRSYFGGRVLHRIALNGAYYDVNELELDWLTEGADPGDLGLEMLEDPDLAMDQSTFRNL